MSDPAEYKDLLAEIEAFMSMQEPSPESVEISPELIDSLAALVAQQPLLQQQALEAHASKDFVVSDQRRPSYLISDPSSSLCYDDGCPSSSVASGSSLLSFFDCPSTSPQMPMSLPSPVITPPTQSSSICCSQTEDALETAASFSGFSEGGESMYWDGYCCEDNGDVPALSLGHLDPRTIRLFKTRFCSFGPECPYRLKGRCIYAHSKEEMRNRPPPPSGYPRLPPGAPTAARFRTRRFDSISSWDDEGLFSPAAVMPPPGMNLLK